MKVSNSLIQTFKKCPRMYELKYVFRFTPIHVSDAIETGLNYHDAVEKLVGSDCNIPITTDPKISAMVSAFEKYLLPRIRERDNYTPEKWFEYKTAGGNVIVGRYDGLGESSILEHKTTGGTIDGNYWRNVLDDEQLLTYMLASGKNHALYTVCQKPRIRQTMKETGVEFEERCKSWYEAETEQKIACIGVFHPDERIEQHERDIDAMCETIQNCTNFYRNRAFCRYYGRECEYAPICNKCDPNEEYIGFTKGG